jgi:hypothetical protein
VSLVRKTTFFRIGRIGTAVAVLVGSFLLAEVLLRVCLSQQKLREGIYRASGLTVQFEGFSMGIFGGVALRGVTATGAQGDSLSVRSVFARPNLWAGLRGRLQLEDVRLQDVRFVRMERAKAVEQALQPTVDSAVESPHGGKKGGVGLGEFLRLAKRIQVANAGVDWMKANGSVRTQLEGIDFRYEETAPGEGTGEVSVQRGIWQEALAVDTVNAKLTLTHELLAVADFSAQCGGGKLQGRGTLRLNREAPFEVTLSADAVDLASMSRELPSLRVGGKAEARFRMEGLWGAQQTWTGDGELTVSDGMFKGLALLQMLGQVFQVQELANLTAKKAHSKIRVSQRNVYLDGLQIDAGDVQLFAPGEVDFKRALSLHAQISLAEHMIKGKALQLFDKRFSAPDAEGRRSLAFQVTGTLDKPKTDLMDKLVGENLGEMVGGALGGVLDQFLGGLLKPRKTAKPAATPEALPEPKAEASEGTSVRPR